MISPFHFEKLPLEGAYLIDAFYAPDIRGGFCKDYSLETFKQNGIDYDLKEVFYTYSHKGVVRALHFQRVKEQPKLVRCVHGHADFPEKSLLTSRTISGLAAKSHNSIKVGWTAKEQADNAELEEELNKPGFFKPIFALYGIKKASDFKNKSFL